MVFGATVYVAVLGPTRSPGESIVSQVTLDCSTSYAHPAATVMVTVPVPPAPVNSAYVGEIVTSAQVGTVCVNANVC